MTAPPTYENTKRIFNPGANSDARQQWILTMIDLKTFGDLASIDVGEFSPKPTTFTEGQVEASVDLWASEDNSVHVGVWECTEGRFSADRSTSSELCHIISGRASLSMLDGEVRVLGPGDLLVLPRGWKGEWTILERVRKLYVMHFDPK